MSQQKLLDQQQQLKNYGRRSRKDQQGRDYICGCGKSYLSYPALYTHIKTKHDGQKPQGTFKVGVSANRKNVGSNGGAVGGNTVGGATQQQQVHGHVLRENTANPNTQYYGHTAAPTTLPKNLSPTSQTQPKLSHQILSPIQQLLKYQDLHILSQLDQTAQGHTFADNRIQPQYSGPQLYQKYHILLKQSQLIQNNQHDEQIISQYLKLSNKSQLDTVLVVYLLGVGRYVSQYMIQYYQQFAHMFRNCFYDHIQQIYQVCYKNNQQYWTKHRQRQITRQRDNPQKCYEYSYPPSSSKSKSYNNLLSYTSSYSSMNNNYNHNYNHISTFNNIVINIDQCKYCPLICQFFLRVYVPVQSKYKNCGNGNGGSGGNMHDNYYINIMELLCTDFCAWMYRHKYTVVEVGLNKKYEVLKRDCIYRRDRCMNTQSNCKDYDHHVEVSWLAVNRNVGGTQEQRNKRQDNKWKNSRSEKKKRSVEAVKKLKQWRQKYIYKNKSKNQEEQQQNQQQNDENQLQNQDDNDEQSYKIGHQIVGHEHEHQSGIRDRSGSIHRLIDGNHGDQHGGDDQINIGHNGHGNGNVNGGSNGSAEEEEIEQYINPCYPGDKI